MPRTIISESLQSSVTKTVSGTSETPRSIQTAKVVEIWVLATAASTANFDFNVQTSIDGGTTWKTVETISVTAVGAATAVINRLEDPMGKTVRVAWTANAGSLTFSITIGYME